MVDRRRRRGRGSRPAGRWPPPGWPATRPPRRWRSARWPRCSGCAASRSGRDPRRRRSRCPPRRCPGWLHLAPRYLAARFAMVDDRLDEARAELLRLLAVAEHGPHRRGPGRGAAQPLRGGHPGRPVPGRAATTPTGPSPPRSRPGSVRARPGTRRRSPSWPAAASPRRPVTPGAACAPPSRRATASTCGRNLHALGQAELRAGDTRAGVATLRRLRDLDARPGRADPMIVRWHGDLAGGLAALGEHTEAAETLAAARAAARRLGAARRRDRLSRPGLGRGALRERATPTPRCCCSAAAALHFEQLSQPIEQAHALLVQGGAERRRRRYAAARVAIGAALAIFLHAEAKPWAEQTERALAGTSSAAAGTAVPDLRAHLDRGAHRRPGPRRRQQPGDRHPAVPQREDRRGDADPGLPQARRPLAHPALVPAAGAAPGRRQGFSRIR